jgi:hypothetical protein
MIRRLIVLTSLSLSLLPACEKKEAPPPPATEATPTPPAPATPPTAAAVAEPVVDVSTLPVEEQYEAEAESEITATNVAAKLDELDKELASP